MQFWQYVAIYVLVAMKDIMNTTDIRTWAVDWFENRFSITRECVEASEKLADVCCYDDVDRFSWNTMLNLILASLFPTEPLTNAKR